MQVKVSQRYRKRCGVVTGKQGVDSRDKFKHIEGNDQLFVRSMMYMDGRARVTRDEERVLRGG